MARKVLKYGRVISIWKPSVDLADRANLTASGWQHDINSLKVSLNMPPGWLLWHVAGPDFVPGFLAQPLGPMGLVFMPFDFWRHLQTPRLALGSNSGRHTRIKLPRNEFTAHDLGDIDPRIALVTSLTTRTSTKNDRQPRVFNPSCTSDDLPGLCCTTSTKRHLSTTG